MPATPAQLGQALALQPGEDQDALRGFGLPQWPSELHAQWAQQLKQLQKQLNSGSPVFGQKIVSPPMGQIQQQPAQNPLQSATGNLQNSFDFLNSGKSYINSQGDLIQGNQVIPG